MSKVENNKRRLTFGNILLILLVIGTFAVMGLMAKLYIELTKTPGKTAQMYQEQQKQQIEVMLPNAQPGDKPIYRDANVQTASKPMQSTQQTAASVQTLPENEIKEAVSINSDVASVKKAPVVKKAAKVEAHTEQPLQANNEIKGEVSLRPTNVQPAAVRSTPSTEVSGERQLKPQPARNTEKAKSREAIDELF